MARRYDGYLGLWTSTVDFQTDELSWFLWPQWYDKRLLSIIIKAKLVPKRLAII